ncbi:MAG TPA: deoxyribonuclease IV [Thermoanaerobaculia bacterium]|nr:deoxyribonuclease IV [Thermoanaerobaculia bacterium]
MTRDSVSDLPLGAHHSIAGGTPNAVERAVATGSRVLQIFVKNSNRWIGKEIADEEAETFRAARANAGLLSVVAHSSYLINAAGANPLFRRKSTAALAEELERCERLGVPALVLHPGSRGESGLAAGVKRVAKMLDDAFRRADSRASIWLETAAGQGACVGARFEELRDVIGASRNPERLGVCLDTCHVFAAGYELRTPEGYAETIEAFDRALGLSALRAMHVNDSKKDLGSRVDRHEHIGRGAIGDAGFRNVMTDPRLAAIPKFLETPKDKDLDWDRKNLARLRKLARTVTPGDAAGRRPAPLRSRERSSRRRA